MRKKYCSFCLKEKNLDSDFYKKTVSKDGYSSKCKICQQEYAKQRYLKNKKDIYKKNLEKRKYLQEEINKLKNKPCIDCGIQYDSFCMDFDHIVGIKFMCISKMIHETFSLDLIKKEIEKCELVCVLCHKNRTYERLQKNKKHKNYSYKCYSRNREIIDLAKSKPCVICGKQYFPWQMEFDHNTDKKTSVGLLLSRSVETINSEISKCQVLCALCHRRKTKKQLWRF